MSEKKISLIKASPGARKFARQLGAELNLIKGSQRAGRINEEDIKTFVKKSLKGNVIIKKNSIAKDYKHSEFGEIETKLSFFLTSISFLTFIIFLDLF